MRRLRVPGTLPVWSEPGNHGGIQPILDLAPDMSAPPFDIHIGYRRGDREIAASLARRLEARGLSVHYDAGIGAGRAVAPEAAVEQSRMIVLLISSEANDGRELRLLANAADRLARPVVSLLIENVQPDGASLAALADRLWIRAHPEPMARIDEIADLLAQVAGKEAPKPAPAPQPETLEEREQSLDAAISELLKDAVNPEENAPTDAAAYVGKAGSGGQPAPVRGGAVETATNVVTLGVYGAMARRRAIRSFRSNIRKL